MSSMDGGHFPVKIRDLAINGQFHFAMSRICTRRCEDKFTMTGENFRTAVQEFFTVEQRSEMEMTKPDHLKTRTMGLPIQLSVAVRGVLCKIKDEIIHDRGGDYFLSLGWMENVRTETSARLLYHFERKDVLAIWFYHSVADGIPGVLLTDVHPMNMHPSAPDDEMMRIIKIELFYQLTCERWSEGAGGSDEFFGIGNIQPMPELNPYVGLQLLGTPSISQAEITAQQEA